MKNSLFLSFLLGLACQGFSNSPDTLAFPTRMFQVHASSMIYHTMLLGNFEFYRHTTDNRFHYGIGVGANIGIGYVLGGGPQITGLFWTGAKNHHFTANIGVTPFFYKEVDFVGGREFFLVPILQVGYRNQKPFSNKYWSIGFGSAGLGFGFGRMF